MQRSFVGHAFQDAILGSRHSHHGVYSSSSPVRSTLFDDASPIQFSHCCGVEAV